MSRDALLLLFFVGLSVCQVATVAGKPYPPPPMFPKAGSVKNAWPELQFQTLGAVKTKLRAAGVSALYVLAPGADPNPNGVAVANGTLQDVWVYATGLSDSDTVYETPKRGLWHHNRLSPGWPELVGVSYLDAIAQITNDYLGVTVIYGPEGQPRLSDLRLDRVYLDITPSGNVASAPFVG